MRGCIGILTLPHTLAIGTSHIMKSYVDWFEDHGIRVLPIPFDTTDPSFYLDRIHGLFLPGTDKGYDVIHPLFMQTLQWFVDYSMRPSVYFPIWGTCFGMEALALLGGIKLSLHPSEGPSPLTVVGRSRMMQHVSSGIQVVQNHRYGISLQAFQRLKSFFRITGTCVDDTGVPYVAAMEARAYPLYAVQFHPERTASPFLSFLHSELQRCSPAPRRHVIPAVGTIAKKHKCVHYEGMKKEWCYFF